MSPYREGEPVVEIKPLPWGTRAWAWMVKRRVRLAATATTVMVGITLVVMIMAVEESRKRERYEYEHRPCVDRLIDRASWSETGTCREMQTLQFENNAWLCRCPKEGPP